MKHGIKFLMLVAALAASCNTGPAEREASGIPLISVSILPQKYFIDQLAGDLVRVNVMVPPGASPHTYEPSASQLTALSKSALYMRIGNIDFEMSWMEKIMDMNRSMKLADLSSGIDPVSMEAGDHEHVHGHVDPHIWMSARNAVIIAGNVYRELVPLLPGKEKELEVRYDSLLTRLDSLETAMEIMLEGLEGRGFMIYHPALTYFARDYGLEQYPVELEGKTPSPAYMRRLTDLAREKNIRSIFLQMQFDQDNARVLSRETGADIIQINPLDPDWYGQMLYIAGKMAWTLQKESQQD